MGKVRIEGFSISLDGYGAGPRQDLSNPLGEGGIELHRWLFPTDTFQREHGSGTGTKGVDDDFASRGFDNVGAWIMGRNMFGPIRGEWVDFNWRGWWGDNPPYHVPVFVLTHFPRPDLTMEGENVFRFVTGGIEEALKKAKAAAGPRDVRIGGGVSTIRQYLQAKLIDELHFAISPVLLGHGEAVFEGLDLKALGYHCERFVGTENATHVILTRRD